MGIAVLIFLLMSESAQTSYLHAIGYAIFGLFMILLFTASTLYHWSNASEDRIRLYRKIDHIMIFMFIAASYTPVCLITLANHDGTEILIAIWSIALFGFFKKIFWLHAQRYLSTLIYIAMGWFAILAIDSLIETMPIEGLYWMIIGGVMYTFGGIIYAIKKPNPWPDYFGFHEIFHIFVLFGSFSHFIMIAYYLE